MRRELNCVGGQAQPRDCSAGQTRRADRRNRGYHRSRYPGFVAPSGSKKFEPAAWLCNAPAAMRVVFDTSVLVAAARSQRGASFALVRSIPSPQFQLCLSVGLYMEWQSVLGRRENLPPGHTAEDALRFLRFLASQAHLQEIHFVWRPFLPDPDDDMVLELAFAAGCRHIVTHNVRDFRGSERLGVVAMTPREFWNLIRV